LRTAQGNNLLQITERDFSVIADDFEVALDVFARELPAAGIGYLLVGGHAVNHYGLTRATQDLDFMIAAEDVEPVRRIMTNAGFTNVSEHEVVLFFNRPGSSLRIDFLRVDSETMRKLIEQAEEYTNA
jgi:hypothetical protein